MNHTLCKDQDFLRVYHRSVRHAWSLEDVASRDWSFDYSLPFMPDPVTSAVGRDLIDPALRVALSQIRGNGYLGIIVLIEDAIVDFLWSLVGTHRYVFSDETQQALINFVSEELKHTLLFEHVRRKLQGGWSRPFRAIERMPSFGAFVMKHGPLGSLLFILHGEIMTYINYVNAVGKGAERLDPYFSALLKFHWIEEAGHVALDELLLTELARPYDDAARVAAIRDYFSLVDFLYGAMMKAADFDLQTLKAMPGASDAFMDVRAALLVQQRHFYLQSYLLDVMESARFRKSFAALSDNAISLLDAKVEYLRRDMA